MKPQDHHQASSAPKVTKEEARLDWSQPDQILARKIRAFNPYPGAYTLVEIKGQLKRLKIWRAHLENNQLVIDQVQLEGKKPVSWKQFQTAYPEVHLKD